MPTSGKDAASSEKSGQMSERDRLDGCRPDMHVSETGISDERAEAARLWTRRSALALTTGFLALGATPGLASPFVHRLEPRANHIVVSKRNRLMTVMNGETELKRYRIGLGFTPEGHKTRSGDGRTPEGRYYVDRRNPRSAYHLSIGINYPNDQDRAKARAAGVNPGGDIFFHGGPRSANERSGGRDWTAGCIAVSDAEIEEMWTMVPLGIPVTIFGA